MNEGQARAAIWFKVKDAMAEVVTRRVFAIDSEVKGGLTALGRHTLDEMVGDDLPPEARAYFKTLIDERVMWMDLHDAVESEARIILGPLD